MMGLTWKNFKISMVLLVITVALAFAVTYLPHLLFAILAAARSAWCCSA